LFPKVIGKLVVGAAIAGVESGIVEAFDRESRLGDEELEV
jgi:hypothetical protein